MAWMPYITHLVDEKTVVDAVIVNVRQRDVLASHPGGDLGTITQDDVSEVMSSDRSQLFSKGLSLGGKKYTVLRDALHIDGENTMDLRSKANGVLEMHNACIGKANSALIIAKGSSNAHGGTLNKIVFSLIDHLRKHGI